MAGAAQTVLGIGQGNQRAAEFLVSSISQGFSQMASAQKQRTDLYENMFKSVLAVKQQEQDAYFKQENLKLERDKLTLDGEYKNEMLGIYRARIDADLEEAKIRAEARQTQESNKGPLSALSAQRIAVGSQLTSLKGMMSNNENIITTGKKSLDYLRINSPVDYHGPKGQELKSRIEKAEEDNRLHSQKAVDIASKFEIISGAVAGINAGGDAPTILGAIDTFINKDGTSVSNPNGFEGTLLIPNSGRTQVYFGDEAVDTPVSDSTKEVITKLFPGNPVNNKDIIIPEDKQPVKTELSYDQLMSTVLDKDVPLPVKLQTIKAGSPEAIKKLEAVKNGNKKAVLLNYASGRGYGLKSQVDNFFEKQTEEATNNFISLGGTESELAPIRNEAQIKLQELARAPENQKFDTEGKEDGPDLRKIQTSYNSWVDSVVDPKEEPSSNPGVMDLSGRIGSTIPTKGKSIFSFDLTKPKVPYRNGSEDVVVAPREKGFSGYKSDQQYQSFFDNKFIKGDKFDKQSFADWLSNDKIASTDLGLSEYTFNSDGDKVEKDPELLEKQRQELIKEIASSKDKSLQFYKKLYGKSGSK